MEKHTVTLIEKERCKLVAIVTKGRNKASFIQRTHIRLKSADDKTDAEISRLAVYQRINSTSNSIAFW